MTFIIDNYSNRKKIVIMSVFSIICYLLIEAIYQINKKARENEYSHMFSL